MTLTLELTPAQETRLNQMARSAQLLPEQIAMLAVEQFLADPASPKTNAAPPAGLRSYRGAGAGSPVGRDAQEYVHDLRTEWDERP